MAEALWVRRGPVRWAILGAYWLFLLAATSIPGNWLVLQARPVRVSDKVAHAAGYTLLALLLCWARRPGSGLGRAGLALSTAGVAALYACLDEWHQQFIPMRAMDGKDLLADVLGAALGVTVWCVVAREENHARTSVSQG
ncbi:MAG: VanZ family protein [Planctomycetes bacterium]|nr:VanZ family protein [Planctomycetota bacterium]